MKDYISVESGHLAALPTLSAQGEEMDMLVSKISVQHQKLLDTKHTVNKFVVLRYVLVDS